MASEVPRVIGDNAETRRFLDSITRDLRSLQSTVGGISPAPPDASYVTLGTNPTLSAERVLTAGTGISLTDGGSTLTVASTVTAGGLTVLSYAGPVGTGSTYTVTGLGGYKMLIVFLRDVSHNNGASQSFRVELSSDGGSNWSAVLSPNGGTSFPGATLVSGLFFIGNTDQTNNQIATVGTFFGGSPTDQTNRGATNALRFSFSAGNFDNGSIDIYGLK